MISWPSAIWSIYISNSSILLTYGVSTLRVDLAGVKLAPQQVSERPFNPSVEETVHRRLEGLVHGRELLHMEEEGQFGTLKDKNSPWNSLLLFFPKKQNT